MSRQGRSRGGFSVFVARSWQLNLYVARANRSRETGKVFVSKQENSNEGDSAQDGYLMAIAVNRDFRQPRDQRGCLPRRICAAGH